MQESSEGIPGRISKRNSWRYTQKELLEKKTNPHKKILVQIPAEVLEGFLQMNSRRTAGKNPEGMNG